MRILCRPFVIDKFWPHRPLRMNYSSKSLAAIVQFTATSDKDKNFIKCQDLILKAKGQGASVVFLPEAFDFIGESSEQTLKLAEPLEGPTIQRYKQLARSEQVFLSLGGFHQSFRNKIKNTHLLINDQGHLIGKYAKTHLFDVDIPGKVRLKESDYVVPGEDIGYPVPTPLGNIGLSICYDLRFPELSTTLSKRGSTILTFPSAFTVTTGYAHWEALLRARAIENQCYVIAAAQVGKHNHKRSSYGHSMIVDPWGTIVAQCGEFEGVGVAEVNLDYVDSVRNGMQVWNNRRGDLYGISEKGNYRIIKDFDGNAFEFGHVAIPRNCLVFESRLSVVSVNKKPVLPGHLLVLPKRKCAQRMSDLTAEEMADLFMTVQTAQKLTETHFGCKSSTVTIQDGPEAGQTIPHLHVHILPRKGDDFARNDEIYEKIDSTEREMEKWRNYEEMAAEAADIRNTFLKLFIIHQS